MLNNVEPSDIFLANGERYRYLQDCSSNYLGHGPLTGTTTSHYNPTRSRPVSQFKDFLSFSAAARVTDTGMQILGFSFVMSSRGTEQIEEKARNKKSSLNASVDSGNE